MTGPWRNWFAWLPTVIDGRTYWLRLVQRRRFYVPIYMIQGRPIVQACWQYRKRP